MTKLPALAALAALSLAACKPADSGKSTLPDDILQRMERQVAAEPVRVDYEKRLSDSETIRGLSVPHGGNIFTGGASDIRCMLYTNDAYKVAQVVCPTGDLYPRDVVVETGSEDPLN